MNRTRIKICGVTRPQDAAAAARAGADAVGVVLYAKAKRYVDVGLAKAILAELPPFTTPVGLFVDAAPGEVREAARSLGLRHVQLHGHESPADVAELAEFVVVKALRVDSQTVRAELDVWRGVVAGGHLGHLRGFVLETAGAGVGGTGVDNDWATVATLLREGAFAGLPPIIAAGGLRPETVGGVVCAVRPYAVDVSSGVEESFGCKCPHKIAAFVRNVGAADCSSAGD